MSGSGLSTTDLSAVVTDGSVDTVELRRAFGRFPSGVVALAALSEDGPVGMSASSFCPASLDPPLVGLCVRNASATWPALSNQARLGLSVLSAEHGDVCRRLAGRAESRFTDVKWVAGLGGAVFIRGAVAWLDCTVHSSHPAGDHVFVLFRVERWAIDGPVDPLVFHAGEFRMLEAMR